MSRFFALIPRFLPRWTMDLDNWTTGQLVSGQFVIRTNLRAAKPCACAAPLVHRTLPCALRQSSVCMFSCAQTINNNMPRGQNSQVILRQRPAAPLCRASRLARMISVSDAARRETRTTRPVAPTATTAPRTTTRTATDPTTTPTTTGRLTTSRPHRRRLRRCTPQLLLRSKWPSKLEKFAGYSLEFGPYPEFRH